MESSLPDQVSNLYPQLTTGPPGKSLITEFLSVRFLNQPSISLDEEHMDMEGT